MNRMLSLSSLALGLSLTLPALAQAAPATPSSSGGLGWQDAAVVVAALLGIALLGLYGDLVVAALIVCLIEAPIAAARAIGRTGRRADRTGRSADPIASRSARGTPQQLARSRPRAAR